MTESNEIRACYAWLASSCMPSAMMCTLLDTYSNPEGIYRAFRQREKSLNALVPPRFFRLLEQNGSTEKMLKYAEIMKRNQIHCLCISDQSYPATLQTIPDPPAILFYQGNMAVMNCRAVAMVGSRKASYSGIKASKKLAADLSRNGITVISGLACGIDAAAHLGCIEGGSPTLAVTGGGLDIVYPKDNQPLRDEILCKGGLILSEYAPGERPAGWHFPVRNRIITGLACALILIEARIRSGSMTSVQHALDQGKDIFVYPGDPSSVYYEGNHQLLREGAIYFTSAEDILADLDWLDNPGRVRQNSDCLTGQPAHSPEEQAVLNALHPGSLHFEELLNRTGLDASVLMTCLTMLQISGSVEALPGKQYQLRH